MYIPQRIGGTAVQTDVGQLAGRSALGKMWKMPRGGEPDAATIEAADGSVMLARLLCARGLSDAEQARAFLNLEDYVPTSPMELPDVDKAVVRISQAIAGKEQITVYGDYDVDGVTGTSVLYTVLRKLGATVDFYIPNRASEGYGLNLKAISILASKHRSKLIITCDCGVSNFAEINFAKSLGVDTLVLDHHTMPEMLPPAVGIVHPKRLPDTHPLFDLPGVGVAYKVCEALLIDNGMDAEVPTLLDYVTLGMIADMVPLIRENRYLVKIGLPILAKSPRAGIKALLAQLGNFEDTDLVGFGLAPRINAVGRLADANAAVELLTTEDPELAETLARQLQNENARRQELCERIFAEADLYVATKLDAADKAIAIYDENWHHGVVGIVASRLVEKYHKPVFIGELDAAEGVVKGSARSVDGIDLYQVLKANEHLLTRWGGHKMAAGFAMEAAKAEVACRALVETCNQMLANKASNPTLDIDVVAQSTEVDMPLAKLIGKLAPFGMSNKKPVFCVQNVVCSASRPLGKEGKHSRIMVLDSSQSQAFECVMWNSRGRVPVESSLIDIAFTPEINSFNGRDRLQLVLADWRVTGGGAISAGNGAADDAGAHAVAPMFVDQIASNSVDVTAEKIVSLKPKPLSEIVASVEMTRDKVREADLEKIAVKASVREELLNVEPPANVARVGAVKHTWKDLRDHGQPLEIVHRAGKKLAGKAAVFGESCELLEGVKFADRTVLTGKEHVIIWQAPPSAKIFQEILSRNVNAQIYLLAADRSDCDDPANFLKRLFGVIKFAVNKKDGQIEGEKLSALMGASKMSVALGLAILRKVGVIDWFTEDGCIYLDLIGNPQREAEDLPEYKQLLNSLRATEEFRHWCTTARLEDIQLAVMPNQVSAPPELVSGAGVDEN